MAISKCKMCAATLTVENNQTVVVCEYCGTQQTVPTTTDENLQNAYNRANSLRIKNEFDKAERIYEMILQNDPRQAEAYWGLVLCKYGIEYVDDPKTLKKTPTCHRLSYSSVVADPDYKSALEYADIAQGAIYQLQAMEIDSIQKEILALSQNEESYDVFICYKEKDERGQRTQESVIANDIYYQLKERGYKVFYAAITLEGKLGSAYEPIIFAALNSAKVMLVLGTCPDNFNAVWVKNEWSRFLKIITKDHSKLLIPCYRGMDAYDLPEEFAHLQAQDMSKISFITDIIRGIEKVIPKEQYARENGISRTSDTSSGNDINLLLKRAFLLAEDEEWARANEFCERVLNINPESAEVYLVKLLIELKVRRKEDLKNYTSPFTGSYNYQKIIRFSPKLGAELKEYNDHIQSRNNINDLEKRYSTALSLLRPDPNISVTCTPVNQIRQAGEIFRSLGDYRDSAHQCKYCFDLALQVERDVNYADATEYIKKADDLTKLSIATDLVIHPDNRKKAIDYYNSAIKKLNIIPDWQNSSQLIDYCKQKVKENEKPANTPKADGCSGWFEHVLIFLIYCFFISIILLFT